MTSLAEPLEVDGTPEAEVLEKAMNLIASFNSSDQTKQFISDLEEAANVNRELIATATDLKAEIDQHELEFSERETDLHKREGVVTATNLELTKTATDLKNTAADLESRESALAKRNADFLEKQGRAISYIDGVIENLRSVKQGFCNV